jgi:hypothetical protein
MPTSSAASSTNAGPGRVLVAIYAVFAVAATSRASYQIATKFSDAPVPYLLSAFAAVVYLVATVALARSGPLARRIAIVACSVELVGVLVVGTLTSLDVGSFPDDTVWSFFGRGYLFIPLVLPMLGLFWLRRTRSTAGAQSL